MNFLTFDIEEWWDVHSLQPFMRRNPKNQKNDRIEESVNIILNILVKYNTKATFFVLGRVAEKYPDIIKLISNKGHDIGTHGHNHKLVYNHSKEEFETDLKKSISAISNITGKRVNKYRAPSYSINRRSLWALEVLVKNGIKIDSRITIWNKRNPQPTLLHSSG
jgi:polysaccharide deacetylase family protein (PEP-CTERM system associated)